MADQGKARQNTDGIVPQKKGGVSPSGEVARIPARPRDDGAPKMGGPERYSANDVRGRARAAARERDILKAEQERRVGAAPDREDLGGASSADAFGGRARFFNDQDVDDIEEEDGEERAPGPERRSVRNIRKSPGRSQRVGGIVYEDGANPDPSQRVGGIPRNTQPYILELDAPSEIAVDRDDKAKEEEKKRAAMNDFILKDELEKMNEARWDAWNEAEDEDARQRFRQRAQALADDDEYANEEPQFDRDGSLVKRDRISWTLGGIMLAFAGFFDLAQMVVSLVMSIAAGGAVLIPIIGAGIAAGVVAAGAALGSGIGLIAWGVFFGWFKMLKIEFIGRNSARVIITAMSLVFTVLPFVSILPELTLGMVLANIVLVKIEDEKYNRRMEEKQMDDKGKVRSRSRWAGSAAGRISQNIDRINREQNA